MLPVAAISPATSGAVCVQAKPRVPGRPPRLLTLPPDSFKSHCETVRARVASSLTCPVNAETIVELGPEHRADILFHFTHLSAEDLYLRFSRAMPTSAVQAYVEGLRFERDIVLGCFDDQGLAAVCHVGMFTEGTHRVGEIGLTVTARTRGMGLASRLMTRSFAEAAFRGLKYLYIYHLRRNIRMAALCSKFNAHRVESGDEVIARMVP